MFGVVFFVFIVLELSGPFKLNAIYLFASLEKCLFLMAPIITLFLSFCESYYFGYWNIYIGIEYIISFLA